MADPQLLSDDDVFGTQPQAQTSQPQLLSDDDVFGAQASPQQKPESFVRNPTMSNLGDAFINTVKDLPGEISAPIARAGEIARSWGNVGANADPTIKGFDPSSGSDWATMGLPLVGGTPEGAIEKSGAEFAAARAAAKAIAPGEHIPLQAAGDLTDAIFGNIERANKYYSLPKEIAGEQSVAAPQVREYLNGIISDIQSDPLHEAHPLLSKLQKTLDALPEDGSVPVSDLLDLRKTSNANFKPERMNDKDGVYAGLNKAVNSGLDSARDTIPHFGDALDVADGYWKNSVAIPITKNTVLQKVFDMEDAHNVRQFNNGQIDDLPDTTKQAANNMVSKIKDVDTYNAVRRLLPDSSGRALDAAVLQNITPTRLGAAVKLAKSNVVHPIDSIRNVADLIWPEATPAQKALIQAVKKQNTYTPNSVKNEGADNAFNEVNAAKQASDAAAPKQAPPAPPLALPAPSNEPIAMPEGAPARTYNPYDLNVSGDVSVPEVKQDVLPPRVEPQVKPWPVPQQPELPAAPLGKQEKPVSFFDVLKSKGGIRPDGPEHLANVVNIGDVPKGVIRPNGMTHEKALQLGIDRGYIPDKGVNPNAPTQNDTGDLYSLMERGKDPHPHYAGRQQTMQDYRNNLELEADKRGINHAKLTNDEITSLLNDFEAHNQQYGEFKNVTETGNSQGSKGKNSGNVQGNEQLQTKPQNARKGISSVGSGNKVNEESPTTFGEDEIPFSVGGKVKHKKP